MTDDNAFSEAQGRVKRLSKTPNNAELLKLYALFKQGSLGDCAGKRPGMLDIRGRAKFDAWSSVKGTPREEARAAYVRLVDELERRYGA